MRLSFCARLCCRERCYDTKPTSLPCAVRILTDFSLNLSLSPGCHFSTSAWWRNSCGRRRKKWSSACRSTTSFSEPSSVCQKSSTHKSQQTQRFRQAPLSRSTPTIPIVPGRGLKLNKYNSFLRASNLDITNFPSTDRPFTREVTCAMTDSVTLYSQLL